MGILVEFNIGDKVRINVLDGLKGRVNAVLWSRDGIEYRVRYFYNCKLEEVYFMADELEKINE